MAAKICRTACKSCSVSTPVGGARSAIEHFEALEQLRALYHGYKIGVFLTAEAPPAGVDTEQDLHAARELFETWKE